MKTNTVFQPILFLACILATLSSCTKKQNNPVYLNAGFKSHFSYQPGSYWVYLDANSGHTDSMYIEYNVNYPPFQGTNRAGINTEDNDITMILKDITSDSVLFEWEIYLTAPASLFYSIRNENFGTAEETIFRMFPIQTSSSCVLIPNYVDGGLTYSNIYEVTINDNTDHVQNTFYISLEKGFVTANFNLLPQVPFTPKLLHLIRSKVIL